MTSRTLSGTSTMQEILDSYPAAQRALFRKYHIGGCSSCGFQPTDLLQNVLSSHGCPDPIDSVIAFIEESQALDDKTKVQPAQLTKWQQSKTPLRLVDMRHPMEAAAGVIPGAVQLTQDLCHSHQCALTDWAGGAMSGWTDAGLTRNLTAIISPLPCEDR